MTTYTCHSPDRSRNPPPEIQRIGVPLLRNCLKCLPALGRDLELTFRKRRNNLAGAAKCRPRQCRTRKTIRSRSLKWNTGGCHWHSRGRNVELFLSWTVYRSLDLSLQDFVDKQPQAYCSFLDVTLNLIFSRGRRLAQ
jgi:hypothetical protein